MFESLMKSYYNLKNGRWDNLPKEKIERLINYQISAFRMNEEQMTFGEIERAESAIKEMIDMSRKINPGIEITF